MDFAEFYREAKDDCLRTVLVSVGDQDTAQELVAEAFARAWASWRTVSRHPAPRAWVVRTALNLSVSRWRRHRRELALADPSLVADRPADGGAADGPVDATIMTALRRLPTRQREVVALRLFLDLDTAQATLADLSSSPQADWRVAWYGGLCELAGGKPDRARAAFSAVYDEIPGELAPKLALAFAAEAAGDLPAARYYFQLVWTIDRSYVSAGFGTARAYLASGDRVSAIAAVAAVPETSSHHAAAQIAAVRLLVAGGAGLSVADLHQADQRLVRLSLEDNDPRRHQLAVEILRAALDWVSDGTAIPQRASAQSAAERILGYEPNERALRFGLERGYRALATLMPERRVELVDMANSVRPRTWI